MLCCGKRNESEDPIIDVDELICAEVSRTFGRPTFCERLSKKYKLEVQWSYVETASCLRSFKITKKQGNGSKIESRKMCLFKTEFTNKTGSTQKYTFKTERQTKSSAKVTVQKGFTLGGSLNVPLGLPSVPAPDVDPINLTGGLTGTLSVTKTKENTFEENLLWSVDSAVEVRANHKTTASLIIEEEKATATFEIKHILMPKELHIPVYLINKGSGKVVRSFDFPSKNLASLLQKNPQAEPISESNGVQIITKGVCDVCYGAKQIISINEREYVATQESIMQDDLLPQLDDLVTPKKEAVLSKPAHSSKPSVTSSKYDVTSSTAAVTSNIGSSPSDDNLKKPLLLKQKVAIQH